MSDNKRAYRQFSNDSDHSSHDGKGKLKTVLSRR